VGAIVSGRGITPVASPSILGGGADGGVGGSVVWRAGCLVRGEQDSRGRDVLAHWHPAPGAWRRGGPTRGVGYRRTGGVGRRRNPRGLDCILHSCYVLCLLGWATWAGTGTGRLGSWAGNLGLGRLRLGANTVLF
jgi:hypothetical protein